MPHPFLLEPGRSLKLAHRVAANGDRGMKVSYSLIVQTPFGIDQPSSPLITTSIRATDSQPNLETVRNGPAEFEIAGVP
jgi:hypothetical protein